ncbi:MAG: histidine kinase [Bacteroidia bacterium]|nr:histidine kinase [Bacteroidia bacterium]
MKYIVIIISIVCSTCNLKSQNFAFTNYSTDDGLPTSQIFQVTKDQKGYIWFSSDAGIGKFDMGKIKVLTMSDSLPDNTVFTLTKFLQNRLLGTCYNHNLFEVDINNYKILTTHKNITKILHKSNTLILQTSIIKNHAFLNTGIGLLNYSLSNLVVLSKRPPSYADIEITFSEDEPLLNFDEKYFSSSNTLFRDFRVTINFKDKKLNYFLQFKDQNINTNNFRVNKLKNGDVGLIIGRNYCILKKNGSSSYYTCNSEIVSAYQDAENDLWLGVRNIGALYFNNSNINNDPEVLLKNNTVTSVCNDNEGGIWLSTLENGIYYSPSKIIKQINSKALSSVSIKKIQVTDQNALILTSANEIIQTIPYNHDNLKIKSVLTFTDNEINNIKTIDGKVFATGRNYSSFLSTNLIKIGNSLPGVGAREILIDKNKIIWIAAYAGVKGYKFDQILADNPLKSIRQNCYGLSIDKANNMIIGSFNGLLSFKDDSVIPLNSKYPLLRSRIDYVFVDSLNRYWLTINGYGLCIYYNGKIYLIKQNDNNINSKVKCIVQNGNDYWIGTKNGLVKINIIIKDSIIENHFSVRYSSEDGLISDEINDLKKLNNLLLIGTSKGFCFANLNKITKNYRYDSIYLKPQNNNYIKNKLDNYFEIENNFDKLFIDIYQPAYRNFKSLKYAYKFDTDSAFVIQNSTTITLENIKYGNYKLIVKNASQINSTGQATINFTVKKPIWLRWWFICLVIILLFFIIYIILLIRTNKIKKVNAEKARIEKLINEYKMSSLQAQMNPHFIFNAFSSIQQFILTKQTDDAYDYLAKFSKLIRLVLESSRDNYINLQNEIDLLTLYLEVEQLRTDNKFKFNIKVNSNINIDSISIPIMLIQPHVENAIWHGISHLKNKDGLITIAIEELAEHIVFTVKDNGVGRKEAKKFNDAYNKQHRSLATDINNERLNLFESNSKIEDLFNNINEPCGTMVTIKIRKNDD